ncbi:MAG: hypothetical protein KGH60_00125 [Candidatus Micrarchaeota archaeon]|nr:hypothetical protein [Candidatus Micrarchaeota archaeon]
MIEMDETRRQSIIFIVALLAIGLIITQAVFHVTVNLTFDDANYIYYAQHMPNGTLSLQGSLPHAYKTGFIDDPAQSASGA